jgi:hypothetical protein
MEISTVGLVNVKGRMTHHVVTAPTNTSTSNKEPNSWPIRFI